MTIQTTFGETTSEINIDGLLIKLMKSMMM